MAKDSYIRKVVAQVGDLPAVPAVVSDVLRMTEDASVPMTEISGAIQRDPALTAKILRVSNSPYYGMRQYVGTLKLALVILGAREVRNTVVGIAVFDTLRDDKTDLLLADDFWNHSLMVAGLSKKLSTAMSLNHQGEDFIAGLLHDIGKMVLCRYVGERYARVFEASRQDTQRLLKLERREFGFTHADAAMALAARWNIPEVLCDALHHHHIDPELPLAGAKDPELAAVVRVANLAARHDFDNGSEEDCAIFSDSEAWEVLQSLDAHIPETDRYRVLNEFVNELKDAPKLII